MRHISLVDRNEWSALVSSASTGTWFQTPEAYDFFACLPEVFIPFGWAIYHGVLRGVCIGYITYERNAVKQFFTRRAIINGGPCIVDDATQQEVQYLMSAVRDGLSSIYIETRNFQDFSPWKKAFELVGFRYKRHLNFHIDCRDAQAMFGRMSETRRRQTRKSLKEGAEVVEACSEQDILDWYAILKPLYREKVRTPLFPLEFFMAFYRRGVGKYLLIRQSGQVIGGIMCIVWNEKCLYEWFICGLDTDYKNCYPSVMATYAAMDYASRHNLPRFDVLGAGEPDVPYGVRDFKAEFGGKLVENGRFIYVGKPFLYHLGALGVRIMKHSFR